ncbi:putative ATP-dependent DNA helicase Q1 [Fusarium oxysporum f. sp. rapae]|uniref:DNA 3'-5' helicase n=2 Tax=Fusarium oxysporum f. sp. rapae TaxID=485398 RepID=A0A8J5TQT2_FUSOX|nr:putative ATP-dependent DNA helicase Q1 [Fusarium oxysporum f. sp. rapae]
MIYFMGKPILMEDLQTMVAKMTADAEDLLWGQLMFKEGNDERFVIPLAGIEDDLTQTRRGQSFIHRNGLAGKEVEMLEDLITSSRKTDLLDQTGEWNRGEEITGLRLINGINRDRNIFIIDSEVVLVTQYHKSLAHFDSPKVIPRFLPGRIGQLFVMYMIYIRPLTDRWEADKWELYGEKMAPPSDFIWHNEAAGGVPWESSQMSAAMGRWTSYYIGRRIMLQDWRHIAIAISKKHARDQGAGRADFEDGEDNHNKSEQYKVPDNLAASHTGQTAANYSVTINILKRLTAKSLEIFRQAADLSVNRRLDRVVIDECHLTFTAAETYRSKLQGLVLLQSLGCPFIFLTGTLPPLRQRDFEEAMQLQNPLYIRASSHRLNVQYAILRVHNRQGVIEVKRRVEARLPDLSAREKGIIYCTSQAKYKALAHQLDCHYYHALRDDSDSQFIAQRKEGFQAWLRGKAPYIVATAALGIGIDVAGIIHVIHLEAPFSIIDYAQEAGRAGRTGEPVTAKVIIEDKDWLDKDAAGEACLDISMREVRRLIRTRGCRRRLLGQCLDGDLRDCKDLGGDDEAKVTRCDNCHHDELAWKSELSAQGIIASHARGRQDAHALEVLESALEEVKELGKIGCRICWMFNGIKEARHI